MTHRLTRPTELSHSLSQSPGRESGHPWRARRGLEAGRFDLVPRAVAGRLDVRPVAGLPARGPSGLLFWLAGVLAGGTGVPEAAIWRTT